MQAVILNPQEKIEIEYNLKEAINFMQEIVDEALKIGKENNINCPGFSYPAREAGLAIIRLKDALEILNK